MYRFERLRVALCRNKVNISVRTSHQSTVQKRSIDKILIANRGEIACRVVRTSRKLGVKTVAVFSEADRNAMHVDQADEAYCIGPASSSQSYLRQDKIISIAKKTKCHAIHPGYGFLSENAEFAELCQKENVIFIGPPANAIRDMGIKNTSKDIMIKAGVPVIGGYHGNDQTDKTLIVEAQKIGFPLMIKAVRGGGGKGMRIAQNEAEFMEALESARAESQKAFGDSAVLLERYVAEPRHVEVQVFADHYGNAVYLFERDCSVQRRHQKIIEEAPAPGISEELRAELGTAAVRAAKAVGYVGAGTVEFIMDRNDLSFHFMEMNTRLQVEHPVTEAITGLDLVEWQLRVAAGEQLPLKQEDIHHNGHSFEARIYAENPKDNFLPGAGRLSYVRTPVPSDTVRVETGVRQGDEVSVHYDPMIAKLVVWGKNRTEALAILRSKLSEYHIAGLDTNIEFIKDLCCNTAFRDGAVHTGFIKEHYSELFPKFAIPNETAAQAALSLILYDEMHSLQSSFQTSNPFSPFAVETGFRLNHKLNRNLSFTVEGEPLEVDVQFVEPDVYSMRINKLGPWRTVTGSLRKLNDNSLELSTEVDGAVVKSKVTKLQNKLYIFTKERAWQFVIPPPKFVSELEKQGEKSGGTARSPMPGLVEKVLIKKGDVVKCGDPLVVINAMKMEHIIKASENGTVEEVLCSIGENVPKDKLLIKLAEQAA